MIQANGTEHALRAATFGRLSLSVMTQQLNEPTEMGRRLAYVVYLACWCVTIGCAVIGFVQGAFPLLLTAALSLICCLALRHFGRKAWHFNRLSRSFPYGDPEDRIPEALRGKTERILRSFSATRDWQQRMELREALAALVAEHPELLTIYARDIHAVHPHLLSKKAHS